MEEKITREQSKIKRFSEVKGGTDDEGTKVSSRGVQSPLDARYIGLV